MDEGDEQIVLPGNDWRVGPASLIEYAQPDVAQIGLRHLPQECQIDRFLPDNEIDVVSLTEPLRQDGGMCLRPARNPAGLQVDTDTRHPSPHAEVELMSGETPGGADSSGWRDCNPDRAQWRPIVA